MVQFSFIATAEAVIVVGKAIARPKRFAACPNFHWYAYVTLTQVPITAVCPPKVGEVQLMAVV